MAVADENPLYVGFRPTLAVIVTWFQSRLLEIDTQIRLASFVMQVSRNAEMLLNPFTSSYLPLCSPCLPLLYP